MGRKQGGRVITATGYTKDPAIHPEGIVVTFGVDMMKEQGGFKTFLQNFKLIMEDPCEEGRYWMHKCTNLPTVEVDHIYIIVLGRLYGRVYCGGYRWYNPYAGITDEMDEEHKPLTGFTADAKLKFIDWSHIILSGPFERAPTKRRLKGFQGFRYCTKLF